MIQGKHVTLRPVELKDLENLRAWRTSPEINRFFDSCIQISELQQERWFEKMSLDDCSHYFVAESDQNPVGVVNVSNVNAIHRNASYGIYTVPGINHGLLPVEAALLVLNWAFDSLNLHKIYADALESNTRAIEFSKHIGFEIEGVRKEHVFHEGHYVNIVIKGLFKERFKSKTAELRRTLIER